MSSEAQIARQVLALCRRAGDAIMEVYARTDVGETAKDDRSPLTEADLVAHRILVDGLPDIESLPVLSEESRAIEYAVRRQWQRYWLVDPLDGTKEFLKRNGEFTVNVALIEDGKPVLGVVHAPALGRSYWADASGAFRQDGGQPREIAVAKRVDGPLAIVASRSHAGPETEAFLARLGADHPTTLQSIGSSLKLCLVAEGAAHLYPRFGPTSEWDIAAAQCVVERAGGTVSTLDGQPLRYNKQDLLNPYFVVAGPQVPWQRYLERGS